MAGGDIEQSIAFQIHADLVWRFWREKIIQLSAGMNHGDIQVGALPGVVAIDCKMVARTPDLILRIRALRILFRIKIGIATAQFQIVCDLPVQVYLNPLTR